MELKGAVLIIGSLLWEDGQCINADQGIRRESWRNENLLLEKKKSVVLPIRYGRKSGEKRFHTFTMIFCNSVNDERSKGYLVPLQKNIFNFDELKQQAIKIANAEGISEENEDRINSMWGGSIGILFNPKRVAENSKEQQRVAYEWASLFIGNAYRNPSSDFAIPNTRPVIDDNGFMQIEWKSEFDKYDFVLASATVPKPNREVEPKEIATAIKDSIGSEKLVGHYKEIGYTEYFVKNRCSGITTFQDEDIMKAYKEQTRKNICG